MVSIKNSNKVSETLDHHTLNGITDVFIGVTFRSRIETVPDGNLKVIQMRDLKEDNLVHLDKAIRVDHPIPRRSPLAQRGDIIFRSRGQTYTAALLDCEVREDVIVASPLFLIRPNKKKVCPGYLLWWINHPSSQTYFKSRAGGTMVRMVSKPSLEALKVSLPPLEQQRNIAQFFNLFVREQNLLKELRKNKARRIQETLMQVALGSYQKAISKTLGE